MGVIVVWMIILGLGASGGVLYSSPGNEGVTTLLGMT